MEKKPDVFALSLIKHLYSYALGRDISFTDDPALNDILAQVKNKQYGLKSVIKAIATSPDFVKSTTIMALSDSEEGETSD
jgi:hypothetical protein